MLWGRNLPLSSLVSLMTTCNWTRGLFAWDPDSLVRAALVSVRGATLKPGQMDDYGEHQGRSAPRRNSRRRPTPFAERPGARGVCPAYRVQAGDAGFRGRRGF